METSRTTVVWLMILSVIYKLAATKFFDSERLNGGVFRSVAPTMQARDIIKESKASQISCSLGTSYAAEKTRRVAYEKVKDSDFHPINLVSNRRNSVNYRIREGFFGVKGHDRNDVLIENNLIRLRRRSMKTSRVNSQRENREFDRRIQRHTRISNQELRSLKIIHGNERRNFNIFSPKERRSTSRQNEGYRENIFRVSRRNTFIETMKKKDMLSYRQMKKVNSIDNRVQNMHRIRFGAHVDMWKTLAYRSTIDEDLDEDTSDQSVHVSQRSDLRNLVLKNQARQQSIYRSRIPALLSKLSKSQRNVRDSRSSFYDKRQLEKGNRRNMKDDSHNVRMLESESGRSRLQSNKRNSLRLHQVSIRKIRELPEYRLRFRKAKERRMYRNERGQARRFHGQLTKIGNVNKGFAALENRNEIEEMEQRERKAELTLRRRNLSDRYEQSKSSQGGRLQVGLKNYSKKLCTLNKIILREVESIRRINEFENTFDCDVLKHISYGRYSNVRARKNYYNIRFPFENFRYQPYVIKENFENTASQETLKQHSYDFRSERPTSQYRNSRVALTMNFKPNYRQEQSTKPSPIENNQRFLSMNHFAKSNLIRQQRNSLKDMSTDYRQYGEASRSMKTRMYQRSRTILDAADKITAKAEIYSRIHPERISSTISSRRRMKTLTVFRHPDELEHKLINDRSHPFREAKFYIRREGKRRHRPDFQKKQISSIRVTENNGHRRNAKFTFNSKLDSFREHNFVKERFLPCAIEQGVEERNLVASRRTGIESKTIRNKRHILKGNRMRHNRLSYSNSIHQSNLQDLQTRKIPAILSTRESRQNFGNGRKEIAVRMYKKEMMFQNMEQSQIFREREEYDGKFKFKNRESDMDKTLFFQIGRNSNRQQLLTKIPFSMSEGRLAVMRIRTTNVKSRYNLLSSPSSYKKFDHTSSITNSNKNFSFSLSKGASSMKILTFAAPMYTLNRYSPTSASKLPEMNLSSGMRIKNRGVEPSSVDQLQMNSIFDEEGSFLKSIMEIVYCDITKILVNAALPLMIISSFLSEEKSKGGHSVATEKFKALLVGTPN